MWIREIQSMMDKELRELLEEIDDMFSEIIPLLHRAGEALRELAEREKGVELEYSIGWAEGGINCLCLHKGGKSFKSWDEGKEWEKNSVNPLFEGLNYLYFDAPFGLG
jgi:hypothetical protein